MIVDSERFAARRWLTSVSTGTNGDFGRSSRERFREVDDDAELWRNEFREEAAISAKCFNVRFDPKVRRSGFFAT